MSNLQVNQNTKTTHQKNLTKNETPLSLTIPKTTTTTTNNQPLDDDHRLTTAHPHTLTLLTRPRFLATIFVNTLQTL